MSSAAKKVAFGVIALALVVIAARGIWGTFGEAAVPADTRTLMDVETGKLYEMPVTADWGPYPHVNPDTGKKTLYATEVCYANECGKHGGTHVIMNELLGKEGPTYCPKCGALVRFHNPGPRTNVDSNDD